MPCPPSRRALAALLVLALVLTQMCAPDAPAASDRGAVLAPPVDAPVVDPFRLPASRWDPGNRGLEYATPPGTVVRASGDGEVVFAGQVARHLHVTVLHPDGLRSTVSYLTRIDVVVGQQVRRGHPLGISGPLLHVSVRAGDEYLDPEALFAGRLPPARLVPDDLLDAPPAAAARAEAAIIRELEASLRGPGLLEVVGAVAPDVGVLIDAYANVAPDQVLGRLLLDVAAWHLRRSRCSPAEVIPSPPAERRVAVLVGGLGSTSRSAGIDRLDTAPLGYERDDVVRFSYRGGRVPRAVGDDLRAIASHPYESTDTHGDLRDAGGRLLELLVEVAASAPGVPIDVYAHSQGGIVTRLALASPSLPAEVSTVVTIATPHRGADVATLLASIRSKPGVGQVLGQVGPVAGIDPTAIAPAQLAERSPLLTALERPPGRVRFLSIAARGDLIVPARNTGVDGATNVVVPSTGPDAHQSVVAAPETARAIALTLADLPLACESFGDVVFDSVASQVVTGFESVAAVVAEWPRVPRPLRPRPEPRSR